MSYDPSVSLGSLLQVLGIVVTLLVVYIRA